MKPFCIMCKGPHWSRECPRVREAKVVSRSAKAPPEGDSEGVAGAQETSETATVTQVKACNACNKPFSNRGSVCNACRQKAYRGRRG